MLTANDIMTKNPLTVTPDMEITKAVNLLLEKKINGLPVVDNTGKLVGILCQSDLVALQKTLPLPSVFSFMDGFFLTISLTNLEKDLKKISAATVSDAMTPEPHTVSPQTPLETIASFMVDEKYHTLPVVDGDKLVGIVGKEDVLRSLINQRK